MSTFNEISAQQLRSLCESLGMQEMFPHYLLLQRFLFEPWGERAVPPRPLYRSLIGDDHSPYEYSVAFDAQGVELRILLEAHAPQPNLQTNYEAALRLTRNLSHVFPVSLERLQAVADLLCPSDPQGPFSLWHAVSIRNGQLPNFKIYMNPRAHGSARAEEVVKDAVKRLGVYEPARALFEAMPFRGDGLDELNYVSLDLSDRPGARVKLYFCHYGISASELEQVFALAPSHVPGDVYEFCQDIVGHAGPFVRKPVTSCFSLVSGVGGPSAVTLHIPVAHYWASDAEILSRVEARLRKLDLESAGYAQLLGRFPAASSACGACVQSYVSYRRQPDGMRLTVYLSPGVFQDWAPADSQEPALSTGVFPRAEPAVPAAEVTS